MALKTWEGMIMRKCMGKERKPRMVKKLEFGLLCLYVFLFVQRPKA